MKERVMEDIKKDQVMAFLAARPSRSSVNPYWRYNAAKDQIETVDRVPFDIWSCEGLLTAVRTYFREVFNAFRSEAQVLCVDEKDAPKLIAQKIPRLDGTFNIMNTSVVVFILPQYNTPANTIISERFWQTSIIEQGITPVTRIHSHHILDAYQSSTDHSTLNSNTLEMVMGHIDTDLLQVGFWLDVKNTPTKNNVWVAYETHDNDNIIHKIPCGCVDNKQAQSAGKR